MLVSSCLSADFGVHNLSRAPAKHERLFMPVHGCISEGEALAGFHILQICTKAEIQGSRIGQAGTTPKAGRGCGLLDFPLAVNPVLGLVLLACSFRH